MPYYGSSPQGERAGWIEGGRGRAGPLYAPGGSVTGGSTPPEWWR
jgi:hypothetical protein